MRAARPGPSDSNAAHLPLRVKAHSRQKEMVDRPVDESGPEADQPEVLAIGQKPGRTPRKVGRRGQAHGQGEEEQGGRAEGLVDEGQVEAPDVVLQELTDVEIERTERDGPGRGRDGEAPDPGNTHESGIIAEATPAANTCEGRIGPPHQRTRTRRPAMSTMPMSTS